MATAAAEAAARFCHHSGKGSDHTRAWGRAPGRSSFSFSQHNTEVSHTELGNIELGPLPPNYTWKHRASSSSSKLHLWLAKSNAASSNLWLAKSNAASSNRPSDQIPNLMLHGLHHSLIRRFRQPRKSSTASRGPSTAVLYSCAPAPCPFSSPLHVPSLSRWFPVLAPALMGHLLSLALPRYHGVPISPF